MTYQFTKEDLEKSLENVEDVADLAQWLDDVSSARAERSGDPNSIMRLDGIDADAILDWQDKCDSDWPKRYFDTVRSDGSDYLAHDEDYLLLAPANKGGPHQLIERSEAFFTLDRAAEEIDYPVLFISTICNPRPEKVAVFDEALPCVGQLLDAVWYRDGDTFSADFYEELKDEFHNTISISYLISDKKVWEEQRSEYLLEGGVVEYDEAADMLFREVENVGQGYD